LDRHKHIKGQTATEVLFLLLIIITSTIFIIGLYSQTHDSTIGISIVRSEINNLANSMDDLVLIKKVSLIRTATGENIFAIVTDPDNLSQSDFGTSKLEEISKKVRDSTAFEQITYQIN